MSKEEFNKLWKDSTKEQILNQYYYDYEEMVKSHNIINELEKWLWQERYEHNGEYVFTGNRKVEDVYTMILDKLSELKGE